MDPQLLSQMLPYAVPLLVVAIVAVRLFRNAPFKVRRNRLWLRPLILVAIIYATLREMGAPGGLWLVADTAAAIAGAVVGYLTAHHRDYTLDAETGEIMGRATPIGTIVFGALFAARYALKLAIPQMNTGLDLSSSAPIHPTAGIIGWTDAGLIFSTAMVTAIAATTWIRTRGLVMKPEVPRFPLEQSERSV